MVEVYRGAFGVRESFVGHYLSSLGAMSAVNASSARIKSSIIAGSFLYLCTFGSEPFIEAFGVHFVGSWKQGRLTQSCEFSTAPAARGSGRE